MGLLEMKSIEEVGLTPRNEPRFKKMARQHQTWWRINVLKEPCDDVCSRINDSEESGKKFLTDNIRETVKHTLYFRTKESAGMIERKRLYNNLLSSRPVCFIFSGELWRDKSFGMEVLKLWWPQLTELMDVVFEYAPEKHFDNSAFDVAFIVKSGEQKGVIGLEVKYTDSFSRYTYKRDEYRQLLDKTAFKDFDNRYDVIISTKCNQLYRNQRIAESLIQNPESGFDFAYSGLFFYPYDNHALATAARFKEFYRNAGEFEVITYTDFISKVMTFKVKLEIRAWCDRLVEMYCQVIVD